MACASLDSPPDMDHPNPGLLGLPLGFNREKCNAEQEAQARRKLNRRLPLLDRELVDRPIRHGNRNYVGMLYYRLHEYDDAIRCWEKTAAEDPTNLNAIQDLCTAYAKLEFRVDLDKWHTRLEDIQSKLSGNPDEEKRVYARCRAEQAYAACWDMHTQTSYQVNKMAQVVQSFKSALEYVGSLISQDEKEDWCLAIGQAYERLSHRYKRHKNIPKYVHSIKMAAQYLDFSITYSQHTLHKAEAWGVLGNALTYDSRSTSVSIPDFIRTQYRDYWDNPSLCYDKALSLDPGNSWILGRYGHLLMKLGEHSAAMQKCDEAIRNDPSPSSWFTYGTRSQVYAQLARNTSDQQLEERYLRQASEDSKMADDFNPSPWTKKNRNVIACDMAACQEKKRPTLQALGHFTGSFETQDAMYIGDVHLKQGKSLLKLDRWSAVQSFKMAYSTGHSIDFQKCVASDYLLPSHLDHYKAEQKPKNLCAELAYWITDASVRHPCMTSIFEILGGLAKNKFQSEVLDVMEYIVDNQPTMQGVSRMIADGFITLRKTRFRRENFQRLSELQRRHATKMCSSTSSDPITPLPDHRPPEKAKNPNWQNDFYVITSKTTTPWVQYSLLPAMECSFCSLKGFYQKRDQATVKMRLKSQADAISKSASIVIVHSEAFSADKECQHLFVIACKKKVATQIALLKLDNTEIAPHMAHIETQFDFSGSQTQVPSRWFDLAKFINSESKDREMATK